MKNDSYKKEQMREQEIKNKSIQDLFEHFVSCSPDLTLLTLKGHLIIESSLDAFLALLLRIPNLPEDEKLEFAQKLSLVQAFVVANYESGPNLDLFCVIKKLNTVRNNLAHNLKNPEQVEIEIGKVLESYDAKAAKAAKGSIRGTDLAKSLTNCVIKLLKFLMEIRMHFFKIEMER